jgi:uncharacterized protein (DUF362 family)
MTDQARVVLQPADSYEESVVSSAVAHAIDALGGWGAFVSRGDRVLVKPNCITGAPPEQPAQTHPAVILEVCRQLRDVGCRPFVGDSPAWGSLRGNLRKLGALDALEHLGVPVVDFKQPVRAANPRGQVFKRLTVDAAALEADAILNLPKFKTHQQLLMTVAIKNMFGCVGGRRKALWHCKAGSYENYFARMLVETYVLLQPAISIVDAIVAMEGKGPARGTPRPLNLLLASADGVAIERVSADIIGVEPSRMRTLAAARELNVGVADLDRIDIVGPPLSEVRVTDFQLPRLIRIGFSIPRLVRGALKNAWLVHRDNRCPQTGSAA